MLTVHIADAQCPWAARLGRDLARAVMDHPLAAILTGTVMMGAGDPFIVPPDGARPRVIVPLAGSHRLSAIALDQVATASAAVLLHADELPRAIDRRHAPPVIIVCPTEPVGAGGLLCGTSPYELIEARDSLADATMLTAALTRAGRQLASNPINPRWVADAVAEAIVAAKP